MSEETVNETEQTTTEMPQDENIDLTLQDLKNLKDIIDVASTRGAFKASEMMAVGQTYTKLEKFLAAAGASQKNNQGA